MLFAFIYSAPPMHVRCCSPLEPVGRIFSPLSLSFDIFLLSCPVTLSARNSIWINSFFLSFLVELEIPGLFSSQGIQGGCIQPSETPCLRNAPLQSAPLAYKHFATITLRCKNTTPTAATDHLTTGVRLGPERSQQNQHTEAWRCLTEHALPQSLSQRYPVCTPE